VYGISRQGDISSVLPFRDSRYHFAFLLLAFLTIAARPLLGQPLPQIQAELVPYDLSTNKSAMLTVTVTCPTATPDLSLQVLAPIGFTVTARSSAQLGNCSGMRAATFEVDAPHTYVSSASWKILILLSDKNGQVASSVLPFEYHSGISLWLYFTVGLAGIALGYVVRLIVDSLNNLPRPVITVAAAGPGGAVVPNLGRFTDFIKNHYYFMDFLVTFVLGFLALVALVKDNHTPDSGLYWYSAFGFGFGIGLLTNSDLITRLRTK